MLTVGTSPPDHARFAPGWLLRSRDAIRSRCNSPGGHGRRGLAEPQV